MRCIRDFLEPSPSEDSEALGSEPVTSAIRTLPILPAAAAAAAAPRTVSPLASNKVNAGLPLDANRQAPPPSDRSDSAIHTSVLDGGGCGSGSGSGHVVDLQQPADAWARFRVARSAVDKCCHCIDIVTADMHDVNCFTKAYARYVKGTGSVLATQNLQVLDTFSDWGHREGVWTCPHQPARHLVACENGLASAHVPLPSCHVLQRTM